MIGLVLVAILMSIGVPMFRDFIINQRLRATTSDLRIALTMARSEAVKRNRTVELKSNSGDADWSDGWTIPNPEPGEPDILNHKQTGEVTIDGPASAQFTPAGRAIAPADFDIDVGPEAGALACLRLQLDGRINSIEGACP